MNNKDIIIKKQQEFIKTLLGEYDLTYKLYDVNNTFANGMRDDEIVEDTTGFETYEELDERAYEVGVKRRKIGKELKELTGEYYE